MNWLAFQDSFSLTFWILECETVPWLSSTGAGAGVDAGKSIVSAVSSLSSDSKSVASVSAFVGWTRSCDIFSAELCLTQFLVALEVAGVWNLAFSNSLNWLYVCLVSLTLVHLILSIVLVLLYTLGWSVPFSCMIQYELELHWLTTVAGSQDVFCLCCTHTGIPGVSSM